MSRKPFVSTHHFVSTFSRLILMIGIIAFACLPTAAFAQATYSYTGHAFTLFSCGPNSTNTATVDCSTPGPNANTSYTATDHVTATLILASPLPANLAIQDVRTFAGFSLSMNDGQHTVTDLDQQGMFAEVGTDANGQINQWRLVINTGGTLNGGIATINKSTSVSDQGTLSCCAPTVQGNLAINFSMPGDWSGGSTPSPATATTNLVNTLSNPTLQLSVGQINSLTDKLNNVLASIQAGQTKQAINQLNSFITSVQSSVKTGKISASAGSTLTSSAQAIIGMLSN
jgi:hypothetical protein